MTELGARDALAEFLEKRWWLIALRGLCGVIFGIICFVNPLLAAASLLIVFAVFAVVDGALGLASAFGQARRGERWGWLAVEGVATLVLGVLALAMPAAALTLIYLFIAIKALISGVFLLLASVKLDGEHGQGWLLGAGLVSLAFGALLLLAPMMGGKILVWWIGTWAVIFGALLLLLGFRLRGAAKRLKG
jgi:uncharacterized membrane protein HdeD (DUF308 family)